VLLSSARHFLTLLIMITSKPTSKSQATLPQAVRRALNVRPGDEIAYEIEGDRVLRPRGKRFCPS
jgi:antitoxin PrlF